MLCNPLRCCGNIKHMTPSVFAFGNNNIVNLVTGLGCQKKNYSKDKDCCKDIAQTEGKKVEPWPKPDPPPPAWRCECPKEPQPSNYDPYRIKVPDVVVPPLPPSNAKWTGVVFATTGPRGGHGEHSYPHHQHHPGVYGHQGYGQQPQAQAQAQSRDEEPKEESFFGILKGIFGWGKSKEGKGSGDVSMAGNQHLQWHYLRCSNALEVPNEDTRELFRNAEINFALNANTLPVRDLFHNTPIVHPDYWKDKPERKLPVTVQPAMPKLGYHGMTKYKYAFHEPWKPIDRLALLAQADKESTEVSETTAVYDTKQT